MTTNMVRESAKIYEFPVRDAARIKAMRERQTAKPVIYESGSASWYHEAAIREAERTPKQ
ncbi:DUF2735 domain-containing protein [Rhizobium sp. G187]|uniref:DUF2735 domain-containing protein n=1 Tax=Rhizobium sp. G187 TaxID=3451352 RepID=UPI003EE7E9A0